MKKRFTEAQIIKVLSEHESGLPVPELCRQYAISAGTFYNWKSKYGGLQLSEAKRLKVLELENAKLKKVLAEAELDKSILKDVLAKKY
jgi:putative transposase